MSWSRHRLVTWMRSDPPERRWTSSIQNWTSCGPCSWSARVSTTGGSVLVPPALSTPESEQAEAARATATAASRVNARVSDRRRCMGSSLARRPDASRARPTAHQARPQFSHRSDQGEPLVRPGSALWSPTRSGSSSVRSGASATGRRALTDTPWPSNPVMRRQAVRGVLGAPLVEPGGYACDHRHMAGGVPLQRAAQLGLLLAGLALGAVSLAIARGEPAFSLAGGSPAAGVAGLVAGWSLLAAGLGAWARRPASRFGLLVAAAGLAWLLAEWNN